MKTSTKAIRVKMGKKLWSDMQDLQFSYRSLRIDVYFERVQVQRPQQELYTLTMDRITVLLDLLEMLIEEAEEVLYSPLRGRKLLTIFYTKLNKGWDMLKQITVLFASVHFTSVIHEPSALGRRLPTRKSGHWCRVKR